MALPDIIIEKYGSFQVVRDDLVEGGSKRRVLERLMSGMDAQEFVYPATPCGCGQLAVALSCRDFDRRAKIFNAGFQTSMVAKAISYGADVEVIAGDDFSHVIKAAQDYAARTVGARYFPAGLDDALYIETLADIAAELPITPDEVWCAAGSGSLSRALQMAWPEAVHHAVSVRPPDISKVGIACQVGKAKLHLAPEAFDQSAEIPPPFPSMSLYDSKVWRFMQSEASPNALFWNM